MGSEWGREEKTSNRIGKTTTLIQRDDGEGVMADPPRKQQ